MNVVDTHVHVWDLSRHPYSWTNPLPLLNRSFLIEEYDAATRDLEISKVILVEADVDDSHIAAETGYLLALADKHPRIAGVVAGGRPETEHFPEYLEAIRGATKLKGIRRVLHTQPDELGASALFSENVRRLEDYGLSFDLCVLERQLPVALSLVKRCPGVVFILDHCGCPQAQGKGFEVWKERIAEIADLPNVVGKISGLVGYTGHDDWAVEEVGLRIDWVVRCFGWNRLVFGSDWPVCTLSTSPREWVEVVGALTRDQPDSNRCRLFAGNAERVYRL